MITDGQNCSNCKHYYAKYGQKGNVVDGGCEMETQIPFFDMDDYIANPNTDSCPRWEGTDEKG